MLIFDYKRSAACAVVTWDPLDENSRWLHPIRDILREDQQGANVDVGPNFVSMPWWAFLAIGPQIESFIRGYNLQIDKHYSISSDARILLRRALENRRNYNDQKNLMKVTLSDLRDNLSEAKFTRDLTPEQIRNVCALSSKCSGATFSVPGAGKTTEALAVYAYRSNPDDKLLVVAPKNAFAAWDEQFRLCFPSIEDSFVRLRGASILKDLDKDPRLMLISYQQLVQSKDVVYDYVVRNPMHIFLDESHRIKGISNITTEAVLGLSHLAKSKLIMSGTPMPQSISDMTPQIRFLFPEIEVSSENVMDIIGPIYVRTTKRELGLPDVTHRIRQLPMDPIQRRVYDLIRSEIIRNAAQTLRSKDRQAFRELGKSIVRAQQITSNPALLAKEISFVHSDALADALKEGKGSKIEYLLYRVRALVDEGKKVLVWTTFVENVETISSSLSDVGSVYIHGGVDAGEDDDDDSREGKIKRFREDPSINVLVANPAAAGEGVSLHTCCHHAIYLDRNFNAAQYLQSEDRIHRLGLAKDTETIIEILECEDSIDQAVRFRLDYKIGQMAKVLNDPGLSVSNGYVESSEDGYIYDSERISSDDIKEILRVLKIG